MIKENTKNILKEYDDRHILLESRMIVEPLSISNNTLQAIDSSASNLKEGKVSKAIDLSKFKKNS